MISFLLICPIVASALYGMGFRHGESKCGHGEAAVHGEPRCGHGEAVPATGSGKVPEEQWKSSWSKKVEHK